MVLKDIATIKLGYPFRSRVEHNPAGTVGVVQMRDVFEVGGLVADKLTRVNFPDVSDKHTIKAGDIVFRSRGLTNTSMVVSEGLGSAVVAAPLMVIRAKGNRVLPEYLSWLINQPAAQNYFAGRSEGSAVQMINIRTLGELPVVVPDVATQQRIVELARLAAREKELLEKLADRRWRLVSLKLEQLLQDKTR